MTDLLKPYSQNIIIFYDDAQNVYGRKRPNWSNTGINITPDRSRVMKTCYRNTKQIINLAYNVLLGSCADENTRVKTRMYSDINYLKKLGLVEDYGDWVRVNFAVRNGPAPVFKKFDTEEIELNWVVESVRKLIKEKDVRPEDILIITYRNKYCERLSQKLKKGIPEIKKIINAYKKDEKDSYIFEKDAITISTIHGAKGYEAPVVFLIALDDFATECPRVMKKKKNINMNLNAGLFFMLALQGQNINYI